ncbi:MAG: hypothetical protein HWE14_08475 [Flavobacteriia bacterium]|nr:hypothetical protein [Flavobacteriia bacterium]
MLKKISRISLIVLSILPLGLVVNIFTFYFHTAYLLGHLPTYNNPDPKSLGIHSYYDGPQFAVFLIALVISLWSWPIAFVGYAITHRKAPNWRLLILSILGYGSIFLLMYSGAMEWYLD